MEVEEEGGGSEETKMDEELVGEDGDDDDVGGGGGGDEEEEIEEEEEEEGVDGDDDDDDDDDDEVEDDQDQDAEEEEGEEGRGGTATGTTPTGEGGGKGRSGAKTVRRTANTMAMSQLKELREAETHFRSVSSVAAFHKFGSRTVVMSIGEEYLHIGFANAQTPIRVRNAVAYRRKKTARSVPVETHMSTSTPTEAQMRALRALEACAPPHTAVGDYGLETPAAVKVENGGEGGGGGQGHENGSGGAAGNDVVMGDAGVVSPAAHTGAEILPQENQVLVPGIVETSDGESGYWYEDEDEIDEDDEDEEFATQYIAGDAATRLPPDAPYVLRLPMRDFYNVAYNTTDRRHTSKTAGSTNTHIDAPMSTARVDAIADIWQHAVDLLFERQEQELLEQEVRLKLKKEAEEAEQVARAEAAARAQERIAAAKAAEFAVKAAFGGEENDGNEHAGGDGERPHTGDVNTPDASPAGPGIGAARGAAGGELGSVEKMNEDAMDMDNADEDADTETETADDNAAAPGGGAVAGDDAGEPTAEGETSKQRKRRRTRIEKPEDFINTNTIDDDYDIMLLVDDSMRLDVIIELTNIVMTQVKIRAPAWAQARAAENQFTNGGELDAPMLVKKKPHYFRSVAIHFTAVAASFAQNAPSSIVVDIGASTTNITAIDEGTVASNNNIMCKTAMNIGLRDLQGHANRLLESNGAVTPSTCIGAAGTPMNPANAVCQEEEALRQLLTGYCRLQDNVESATAVSTTMGRGDIGEFSVNLFPDRVRRVRQRLTCIQSAAVAPLLDPSLLQDDAAFVNTRPFAKWHKNRGGGGGNTSFKDDGTIPPRDVLTAAAPVGPSFLEAAAENENLRQFQLLQRKGNLPGGAAGEAVLLALARLADLMDGPAANLSISSTVKRKPPTDVTDDNGDVAAPNEDEDEGLVGIDVGIMRTLLASERQEKDVKELAALRKRMLNNIIIIGDAAHISGIAQTLEARIKALLPRSATSVNAPESSRIDVKVYDAQHLRRDPALMAWCGGCLMAIFDVVKDGWAKREQWVSDFGPSSGKYSTVPPKFAQCLSFIGI